MKICHRWWQHTSSHCTADQSYRLAAFHVPDRKDAEEEEEEEELIAALGSGATRTGSDRRLRPDVGVVTWLVKPTSAACSAPTNSESYKKEINSTVQCFLQPRHTFLEPLTRRHTAFLVLILYTRCMMYNMCYIYIYTFLYTLIH